MNPFWSRKSLKNFETRERSLKFFCIWGRRKSKTLFSNLTISEGSSSSRGKGGVSEVFKISIFFARISISPLIKESFTVPSGRRRTRPVILRTYSLRARSPTWKASALSGSQTTWTTPSRSRKSMKITPPWSLLRWTHPNKFTSWSRYFEFRHLWIYSSSDKPK